MKPKRATAYPAECLGSGRRAREVIPAAARALVRMIGWWITVFVMTGSNNQRWIFAHIACARNEYPGGRPARRSAWTNRVPTGEFRQPGLSRRPRRPAGDH
ncbi:MAG: hypothetical protein BGP23_07120 [Lysobacterales bacterium 66-474]|nr:MAG: hypothetical protein BGP23_07120 [Xanthomonadales bacterium 66-474]